ncbi:hypothetical protein Tco_1537717, partial [Tanacetum coccineum]
FEGVTILTPVIKPFPTASSKALWRPSITKMKRKVDRGSPCLRPRLMENSDVRLPLIRIEALEELRQASQVSSLARNSQYKACFSYSWSRLSDLN